MSYLSKKQTDKLLFSFLENIYQFQQLEFKIFNLNWQHIYFLQLIKKGKISTITDASKLLNIELYQTSRIVSYMQKEGYVKKNQTINDKRSYIISITHKGIETIEKIEKFNYKIISKNSKKIDDKQIKLIVLALKKIKEILF